MKKYKFNIKAIRKAEKKNGIKVPPRKEDIPRKEEILKKDIKSFYVRIPKKWWLERLEDLNPAEKCILVNLMLYANREGYCYPSLRKISADLKITKDTTRKYLRTLEKKGHIKIIITKKGYWNKWTYKLVPN